MKSYRIDPNRFTLDEFFELTAKRQMIPSRLALQEDMERRLEILKASGISQLSGLLQTLRSKDALAAYARKSGLPENYLTLLRREAGSYLARPFPLEKFPGVPYEYCAVLKSSGIQSTRDFFEAAQSAKQQKELALATGIPVDRIGELYALCDLSRITGIGPVFARVVYVAGIRSVAAFAQTRAEEHHRKYLQIIDRFDYQAGNFSAEDMAYCILYAGVIRDMDLKNTRV